MEMMTFYRTAPTGNRLGLFVVYEWRFLLPERKGCRRGKPDVVVTLLGATDVRPSIEPVQEVPDDVKITVKPIGRVIISENNHARPFWIILQG